MLTDGRTERVADLKLIIPIFLCFLCWLDLQFTLLSHSCSLTSIFTVSSRFSLINRYFHLL